MGKRWDEEEHLAMWAIESSKPCSTLNENKIGLSMKYD